jgi:RNA polymerase sigma-70 factor, ECF subfamily
VTDEPALSQVRAQRVLAKVERASRPDVSRGAVAFERLYVAYQSRIYGFLFRMTGARDRADDLFQETWLRVARNWADRGAAEVADQGAWLFTIARNVFVSERRASATNARGIERLKLVPVAASPSPERIAAAHEDAAALEEALLEISDDDRAILWLVAAEGLEQRQVARVLGIDYAAVRQRLARARQRLADRMTCTEADDGQTIGRKESQP